MHLTAIVYMPLSCLGCCHALAISFWAFCLLGHEFCGQHLLLGELQLWGWIHPLRKSSSPLVCRCRSPVLSVLVDGKPQPFTPSPSGRRPHLLVDARVCGWTPAYVVGCPRLWVDARVCGWMPASVGGRPRLRVDGRNMCSDRIETVNLAPARSLFCCRSPSSDRVEGWAT